MGFLDDVQEPFAVPGDQEYKIRLVDVRTGNNKSGNPYLLPVFEIPDEPTAKEFTKYLGLPHEGMSPKQLNSRGWTMKSFCHAMDIDVGMFEDYVETFINNPEADPPDNSFMIGADGWAILGLEESDQWGEQNYVKKFVVPK